jgi:hypothetical protein
MRAGADRPGPSNFQGVKTSDIMSHELHPAGTHRRQLLLGGGGKPAGEVESLTGRALREDMGSERMLRGGGATQAGAMEVGRLEGPALGRGGGVEMKAHGADPPATVVLGGDEPAGVLNTRQGLGGDDWSGGTSGLDIAGSREASKDSKGTPAQPRKHTARK